MRAIPVYWINLDRSVERRREVEDLMKKYNMEHHRFPAIDGKTLDADSLCVLPHGYPHSMNELGCLLSHLELIKQCSERVCDNCDVIMIAEDDVSFEYVSPSNFPHELNKAVENAPSDWEILQLSWIVHRESKIDRIQYQHWKSHIYGTACYLINRKGINKIMGLYQDGKWLLDAEKHQKMVADYLIYHLAATYTYRPPIVTYRLIGSQTGNCLRLQRRNKIITKNMARKFISQMDTSEIVQSMWIGPRLSRMETACIKSFLKHGHQFHLYVYGDVEGIPEGTVVKDGNEILDKSEIFYYKNNSSPSAFSNLFRYRLLETKGGWWTDTDIICVRSLKTLNQPIVVMSQPDKYYNKREAVPGLMKFPIGHQAMTHAVKFINKIKPSVLRGKILWGIGPRTMREIMKCFSLEEHVLPWRYFCNSSFAHWKSLIDPEMEKLYPMSEEAFGVHLWNEMWCRAKQDKDGLYPGTLYGRLVDQCHSV